MTLPGYEDLTPVGAIPAELYQTIEPILRGLGSARLDEMRATGIDTAVMSLTAPGIQRVPDPVTAVQRARVANDALATMLSGAPGTNLAFAAVALQDPVAAAGELERAVTQLGFKGALVNGYSNVGSDFEYGDAERLLPFWERVAALGVPVYLHPRESPPGMPLYQGRPELGGPVWNFAVETSTHAARLIVSGLFDRFPRLNIILGHLGEGLLHSAWRVEHWLARNGPAGRLRHPFRHYLRTNFYFTTSGCFHTPALENVISEVGADRVLYSVDSPYESLREAAEWFDAVDLAPDDRRRIAWGNAARLLGLER